MPVCPMLREVGPLSVFTLPDEHMCIINLFALALLNDCAVFSCFLTTGRMVEPVAPSQGEVSQRFSAGVSVVDGSMRRKVCSCEYDLLVRFFDQLIELTNAAPVALFDVSWNQKISPKWTEMSSQ